MVPVVTSERQARALPPEARLDGVVRLLRELEELPADATGALTFGDRERAAGAVLIEGGRVCWAGARGLSRRLTDLLVGRGESSPSRAVIHRVYRECRRDGRPLGERLVEGGWVSAEGLREALIDHSVEAMTQLCSLEGDARFWVPHRAQRYDAAYTFAPVELLTPAARGLLPERSARGAAELRAILDGEGVGLALHRGGAVARPVPVARTGPDRVRVEELDALARWAVGVLDLTAAIDEGRRHVLSARSDGTTFVAWRRDDLLYAAVCDAPTVGACVVARLRRPA